MESITGKPKVFIITPPFNRAKFIEQPVNSVFGRTYTNFELLISGDESTDDTRDLLDPSLADSQLRYFDPGNGDQRITQPCPFLCKGRFCELPEF